MILLALAAALLQTPSPASAQVESLLTAGQQHLVGRVVGRYAALDAFRRAARLAPADPAPLYWQMKTGFFLGSDEGDVLAREAILRILAIDPGYADVWDRFHEVYQNPATWRRAERALAAHPDNLAALRARAELAIALGQPQRADSLLEAVEQRTAVDVTDCLLRAEANFVAGNDSAGYRWYAAALAHAADDSTGGGALWDREELRLSRVLPTRSLVAAVRQASAKPVVFLQGSAMGFYGSGLDDRDPDRGGGSRVDLSG